MYRFGDGTPFPIQENFIDTLLAAIDACVGTFAAAAEIDDRREKTRIARKEAEEELHRFGVLEHAIESAVMPHKPSMDKLATASAQGAARALAAARTALVGTRAQVETKLQQLSAEPRNERSFERARVAIGAFFDHHALPDTAWRWTWSSTPSRTHGEAMALSGKFRIDFDLDVMTPWNAVVRVGAIAPGLRGVVLRKKTFGGLRRAAITLDKCGVVAVERSPDREVLVLRENAAKPSPGWRVTITDPERSGVCVVQVDVDGRAHGAEIILEGDEAAPFERLWEAVECDFLEMLDERRRMRELHLGDTTLDQVGDPATLGRTLLGVLGPLVRQIRTRSRVPGELAIKRDVDDGRREELYVPRADVERRFATLPQLYRRPFEDIGLGRLATAEIVSSDDAQTMPDPQHRLRAVS
jgi:hypothetical protein